MTHWSIFIRIQPREENKKKEEKKEKKIRKKEEKRKNRRNERKKRNTEEKSKIRRERKRGITEKKWKKGKKIYIKRKRTHCIYKFFFENINKIRLDRQIKNIHPKFARKQRKPDL